MKWDQAIVRGSARIFIATLLCCARPDRLSLAQTISVTTQLVTLNVMVRDVGGNPVRGLSKDDFKVFDDGKVQTISFFSPVTDDVLHAPNILPVGTYTNDLLASGSPQSATVIVFNALTPSWDAQAFALNQVRQFLLQIRPDEHIAIYVIGKRLRIVHDLARDASDIVAAMREFETHSDLASQEGTGIKELDEFLNGKDNTFVYSRDRGVPVSSAREEFTRLRNSMTLFTIDAVVRHLAGIPGRKNVIWISSAPPFPDPFINANVSVYPIDAQGLQTRDLGFAPTGSRVHANRLDDKTSFDDVARHTGGRPLYLRNDIATAIRRAADDARYSYSVGYYPSTTHHNGDFGRIKVEVNRPTVTVLARDGYFANSATKPLPPTENLGLRKRIAESPLDATSVPFQVSLTRVASTDPAIEVGLMLWPSAIVSRTPSNNWQGEFNVTYVQLTNDQRALDATEKNVRVTLTPSQFEAAVQVGLKFPTTLRLFDATEQLCIIVESKQAGDIGSLHIPLHAHQSIAGASN